MGIREIPASFRFTCDGCGATEDQKTKSRPKYWTELHILRDAYDYQGAAVADGSVKRTLCLACSDAVDGAINKVIAERNPARVPVKGDAP